MSPNRSRRWLNALWAEGPKPPWRRSARRPPLLCLERLEDRLAPSVFAVTNTLDDGSPGSLRWAINQVNADAAATPAAPDTINFNIPWGAAKHVYYRNDSTSGHLSSGFIVP